MTSNWNRVFVYCALIIMLAIGVFCFLGGIRVVEFGKWAEAIAALGTGCYYEISPSWLDSVHLAVLGIVFSMVSFLGLTSMVVRPRTEGEIVFPGPAGPVSVTIGAVEDFLRRIVTGIEGVTDARVRVAQGTEGIEPKVVISSLAVESSVPRLAQRVQDSVREELKETLGFSQIGPITVNVRDLRPKRSKMGPPSLDVED